MTKIRVLTISKPYVSAAYREKLRILAKDSRFEIGLITPENWAGQNFEPSSEDNFWHRQLPIVWNGKNHFFLFRNLKSVMKDFAPDVLNVEEEHYSAVTFQCYRLAVQMGIPSCFYTWQNIYKTYPPPFSWIEKYVFKHTKTAIAGNEEAKDVLIKKGFSGQIAVIPQMGASVFSGSGSQKNIDLPRDRFVVTYAGRLVEEKGIDDFIQAIAKLKDSNILGLIIGSGPREEHLRQMVTSLGIENHVRFVGVVPSHDIYPYYQHSQALCLPSHTRPNWKEQFGRVLIESMLYGVIPIGSNSGEIPHVIADAGKVFPEGSVDGLAGKMRELMTMSPAEFAMLKEKAIKRVKTHFTNEVVAEKFAQVFVDLSSR
ncbi:MAG: glycosyltransferase family 4 protein [Oligoflexus sp.]